MISLYAAATANGQRAAIAFEETGLPYTLHKVDLASGVQRSPEFLARNPMGQVPTMVDPDGLGGTPMTVSQSSAILWYAAQKSGKFLPTEPGPRYKVLEWVQNACTDTALASNAIFQVSVAAKEKVPSIIEHFENRLLMYLRVFDSQLRGRDHVTGDLTVADFALYPICAARKALIDKAGNLPHLTRWMEKMAVRPAVAKAMQLWV